MISSAVIFSALELGCIYALVALALFLSFRVLNIADMTTDGTFTLGCAVPGMILGSGTSSTIFGKLGKIFFVIFVKFH